MPKNAIARSLAVGRCVTVSRDYETLYVVYKSNVDQSLCLSGGVLVPYSSRVC